MLKSLSLCNKVLSDLSLSLSSKVLFLLPIGIATVILIIILIIIYGFSCQQAIRPLLIKTRWMLDL